MQCQVKFYSPQNISRASQQNSVATRLQPVFMFFLHFLHLHKFESEGGIFFFLISLDHRPGVLCSFGEGIQAEHFNIYNINEVTI